jgi:acetyltransferase
MSDDASCCEARKILLKNGIPSFRNPEEAVSTFMYMYSYTRNMELLYETPEELPMEQVDLTFLKGILRHAFCEGRKILTLPESILFLDEYKIPSVKTLVARTSEEAENLSSKIGYPVVMKALSPQVTHKTKIEGVILNICSPSEIITSFSELAERVRNYSITAEFQGVIIQPMIREKGYELFIGSKKDPQFDAVIIFGMGGTNAEYFKDINIGFPPLNQVLARRLVEDTAIYKHATATGNTLNVKILEEILVKFSQLVTDFPEIREIDINPLIINENSAVAVDARIILEWDRIMREVAEHHDSPLIASYPRKYVATRRLKDGTEVVLRPIKPEDEGRFNDLFKSLSAETMQLRFFEIIKEMSHETLTRYCNLDYDREIAIVAEPQKGGRQIIGAVRLIIEPDRKTGEFAILVGDEWQGRGLGSKLMDSLVEVGRDMRLQKIYGYIIASNYKMLSMCSKKGFKTEILDEDTVMVTLVLS